MWWSTTGTGNRAPSHANLPAGLADPAGGPLGFVIVDDETGDIEVPVSWPLRPAALNSGDVFRVLYMTSEGGTAESSDIADYDAFVRSVGARSGMQAIQPYVGFFKVFANTRSSGAPTANVAGRAHVGMWTSNAWADGSTKADDPGTPIYWISGRQIADNYFDFCDGNWDNRWSQTTNYLRHEDGVNADGDKVWTGMRANCTLHANPLGHSANVSFAAGTQAATQGPLRNGQEAPTNTNRFYAMSPVFKLTGPAIPNVSFKQQAISANEGEGTAKVTVVLSDPSATDLTVRYQVPSNSAAKEGVDVESLPGTLTVPKGTTEADIEVVVVDDNLIEDSEFLSITLLPGEGYFLGARRTGLLTILDDDEHPGAVKLSVDTDTVSEGGGAQTITVTASLAGTSVYQVDRKVKVSVDGSGAPNVVGFTAVPDFEITIDAESSKGSNTFTLTPTVDAVYTDDETVTVSGEWLPVKPAIPLEPATTTVNSATVTVADDDPAIEFSAASVNMDEGDTTTYSVVLAAAPSGTVTVTVSGAVRNVAGSRHRSWEPGPRRHADVHHLELGRAPAGDAESSGRR